MSYAGVSDSDEPSQNAAWFRAWSSVLPTRTLNTILEANFERTRLGALTRAHRRDHVPCPTPGGIG